MKGIRNYTGSTDNTPISAVWRNKKIDHITSKEMVTVLWNVIQVYGQTKLGMKKVEIGTHSIKSGAATAMYLDECSVYLVMMISWWTRNAFLLYIRKQVEQLSHNMSSKMFCFQFHWHVPDKETRISKHDQRQLNHPNIADTKKNGSTNPDDSIANPSWC